MREFLSATFGESLYSGSPLTVGLRIAAAVLLGMAVAWIHKRTTPEGDGLAMRATLVLLAGLIAMVTQVIGDNVARAFSLVGALSIVRFRTVVRDTRDTAFVIFAVAVGMAIGAQVPWTAVAGVFVLGAAAFLLSPQALAPAAGPQEEFLLIVRTSADLNLEDKAGPELDRRLSRRSVHWIRTTKQGVAVDHSFTVTLRKDSSAQDLVQILNRMEGVQEVKLLRRETDEELSKS